MYTIHAIPSRNNLRLGLRVSDSGFEVEGFGFSGFGFRLSGVGFRVSGFRFQLQGFVFRVPCVACFVFRSKDKGIGLEFRFCFKVDKLV